MSIDRARSRRRIATKSEGILWSLLRAKQVGDLKFRREHPIGSWIVDFACVSKQLVVEIDGGYHEQTQENDQRRQLELECLGWRVLRFTAESVEEDAESIAKSIALAAGVDFQFTRRQRTGSGQKNIRAKPPKRKT